MRPGTSFVSWLARGRRHGDAWYWRGVPRALASFDEWGGAARRVVVETGVEGAATTGCEACCVGATGVIARRLEKVGGDRDGTAGARAGVAGDHAAAAGRRAGKAGGILVAGGGWFAATRVAVAAGREVCGVALTKKGESSGDLGRGIGNLVLHVTAS